MQINLIFSRPMRLFVLLFIVLLSAISSQDSAAQSVWKNRQSKRAFLLYDTQARQPGDILTVLVEETTDVENRDRRALDRGANSNGGFSFTGALGGNLGSKAGSANAATNANGNGEFDGNSSYSVERGFADRITVTVVTRLPNGNLIIRGCRHRIVSGERRSLHVSGVIRPIDIRPDNVIESQYIADFKVKYNGDGIESRFTEQGWAARAWNKYRPL